MVAPPCRNLGAVEAAFLKDASPAQDLRAKPEKILE